MRKIFISLMMVILLTFVGCSDLLKCDGCNKEMDALIAGRGSPEEINKYDSGDYHSWTFWYWCGGFSKTFTWGGSIGCGCEESTYTFSPICY